MSTFSLRRILMIACAVSGLALSTVSLSYHPAIANRCDAPGARFVIAEADAAVVARLTEHMRTRRSAGAFPRLSVDRYEVEEWLKGTGPGAIVVARSEAGPPIPNGEPVGLALNHIGGRRFEVPSCIPWYEPGSTRLAAAPEEMPSGMGPPALFIGTEFGSHGPGSHAGLWLDRQGRLLAWDEVETISLSVCPGGLISTQLGWVPRTADGGLSRGPALEIIIRDLATLDVLERIPVSNDEFEVGGVACLDADAEVVAVVSTDGFDDARTGERIFDRDEFGYQGGGESATLPARIGEAGGPPAVADGLVVARLRDGSLGVYDIERARSWDLWAASDGDVGGFALDPSGERVAFLAVDPDGGGSTILVKTLSGPDGDAAEQPDDDARLPLAGVELARAEAPRAPVAGRQPSYVVWTDDEHIAHIQTQRPKQAGPEAGRVTLLDASDLTPVCAWSGWNVAPAAAADGILLRQDGTYSIVAASARNGRTSVIRDLDRRSLDHAHVIVPLQAFDGATIVGEAGPCAEGGGGG